MVLLKHVNNLIKEKSFEDDDFEVHKKFKNKKNKNFMKLIPKNQNQDVKEEFESINKNKKIIEGFSLAAIGKFFGMIAKNKSIIGGIVQIGKFIGDAS